jgi:PAS domain S-box-containing protein
MNNTRHSVLLVDDDPIQRRLGKLRLDAAGFVADTASGVDEARRYAVDAPHASEERHRGLIERQPDLVWSRTDAGDLLFMSSNVSRICGFSPDAVAVAGLDVWLDRVHPEDAPSVRRDLRTFLDEGRPYDREYRWRHHDGRWIWLHSRSSARYAVDGVVHCDGLVTDVTERRAREESLRQSQVEPVGQLAGSVAHDFNNLLMVIMAEAALLSAQLGPADPRRAGAHEIELAAERAAVLARQLLMFSREGVVHPDGVAVERVTQDLAEVLRRLLGEDIDFAITSETEVGKVRIDRGELEQVLVNLVVNARDAMPTGGALTIELADVDHRDTACVRIAVTDTGSGIAPELRPGQATGLGLSTVYAIVTHAGGTLSVTNGPGRGARFEVWLPRVEIASGASAAVSS